MFEIELPTFYQEDKISDFFIPNINDLSAIKNNDYFNTDALEGFIKVADKLEDSLFKFVNIQQQKVAYFLALKKKYEENNEKLRELNDQLVIAKVQKRSFGKELNGNEYDDVIIKGL